MVKTRVNECFHFLDWISRVSLIRCSCVSADARAALACSKAPPQPEQNFSNAKVVWWSQWHQMSLASPLKIKFIPWPVVIQIHYSTALLGALTNHHVTQLLTKFTSSLSYFWRYLNNILQAYFPPHWSQIIPDTSIHSVTLKYPILLMNHYLNHYFLFVQKIEKFSFTFDIFYAMLFISEKSGGTLQNVKDQLINLNIFNNFSQFFIYKITVVFGIWVSSPKFWRQRRSRLQVSYY